MTPVDANYITSGRNLIDERPKPDFNHDWTEVFYIRHLLGGNHSAT
jgi:hypothetical protein